MSPSSVAEASGGVPGAISVWGCLCRVWQWSRRSDADIWDWPQVVVGGSLRDELVVF